MFPEAIESRKPDPRLTRVLDIRVDSPDQIDLRCGGGRHSRKRATVLLSMEMSHPGQEAGRWICFYL